MTTENKTEKKVVMTHAGKAHIDEILACTLLSIKEHGNLSIIRGYDPEKVDEVNYVVDCGGKHDARKFFDHHQDSPDVEGVSAVTLVARRFFPKLYNHLRSFFDRIDKQDNHGIGAVGKPAEVFPLIQSEFFLITAFQEWPMSAVRPLQMALSKELEYIDKVEELKDWLLETSTVVVKADGLRWLRLDKEPDDLTVEGVRALNEAVKPLAQENNIDIIEGYADNVRNPGCKTLFRTEYGTQKGIDLSSFDGYPGVKFAHKAGFLVVFDPAGLPGSIQDLLKNS